MMTTAKREPKAERNLDGYGAGPPPWDIYEVTPETVFAMGTVEPGGATRWRF